MKQKTSKRKKNKKTIQEPELIKSAKVRKVLQKLRSKSEEEEAAIRAKKISKPYIDLSIFPIDGESVFLIKEAQAKKLQLGIFYKKEKEIRIGAIHPEKKEVKAFIKELSKNDGYHAELFLVSKTSLDRLLEFYKKHNLSETFDYFRMNLTGEDLDAFEKGVKNIIDLKKRIKEMPVTQVLNIIFAGALKLGASDIHTEPQKNEMVRLRYRIDGVLQTVTEFPITVYPSIISRVKVLSKMLLNVRDIAQDGRFSIKSEDKSEVDLRVSIIPGNFGEALVIRLLNQDISKLDIKSIGVVGLNKEWLLDESEKKQGMIINSGPTGSGKTTTLYALINRINSPDKKIISIEDPIEYQVPGISQTQVEKEKGYTFESGLRAIVRQDPDAILLGEIRDSETAEAALHAALTGHLVLTTVHANSSAGVIGRLTDLGIKPALIAPAVNVLIAQRLVRKLCVKCKEKYVPAKETIDMLKKMLSLISPKAKIEVPKTIEYLWRAKGCAHCQGLGYRGRVGIFEVMKINDEIQEMIEQMATENEIRSASLENGMITYEQDGIIKAINGTTSLEEIQRVVGQGEYLLDLYEKIVIQSLARGILIENKIIKQSEKIKDDYQQLAKWLKNVSTLEAVKYVLATALSMKAGDIHIEPGEKEFKIRYRIDGILHNIVSLPMNEFLNLLGEIKTLSGFKTQSRQGVIDGRFRILLAGKDEETDNKVDVRVSIILGGLGDIVVMRLLNQSSQATNLKELSFNTVNLKKLKSNISKPNGIVINTGPTGSGKTTTLYSALAYLNRPELKIITVEDPIEYQMDGVIQTQVAEKEDYTFATAVKSLMRQNPDIIMIGEIRDRDTAQAAYQAALTGHLVLSTLHANSAAGSVQRLINMGLSISDVASGTNCFIAQRLVRRLCPACAKKIKPTGEKLEKIKKILSSISPESGLKVPKLNYIYQSVGCKKCHNIGYRGRVPIAEILEIDQEMEGFLVGHPTTTELQEKAIKNGMISLAQDGILKVLAGETSLVEIARVTREIEIDNEDKDIKSNK